MTATPTPPMEDDAKPIRDALAPFAWCIESLDSADWCWSASVEGVKLNSELLDPGCTPSEPFAVVRKSDHDERIARLLAHSDAQEVRLEAAERDASERAKAQATRLCDDFERLGAINRSKWVSTNHGKWEGMAIAYEQAALKCRRAAITKDHK